MSEHFLEIISMNGKASIQDLGRLSTQHLGFSVSGAADEHAFRYANKLITDYFKNTTSSVGKNQQNCATLEVTLGQISLRATTDCIIAITGANCRAQITPTSQHQTTNAHQKLPNNTTVEHSPQHQASIKNWQCYQLNRGDIIDFAMPKNGLYSYIAIQGGFREQADQQAFLGSRAQTENEMSLGFMGEKLTVGSQLFFSKSQHAEKSLNSSSTFDSKIKSLAPIKNNPELFYASEELTLRFIASELFLQLSAKKQQQFLATNYTVSPDSNRMGYRLVPKNSTTKILSETLRADSYLSKPVTFGAIQLPANEQPIVLMKERQTMGGYPLLGVVMQTDLFRLSQKRPGQVIKFSVTNYQQAQQQLTAFHQKF